MSSYIPDYLGGALASPGTALQKESPDFIPGYSTSCKNKNPELLPGFC
jgi:hypothetical protein